MGQAASLKLRHTEKRKKKRGENGKQKLFIVPPFVGDSSKGVTNLTEDKTKLTTKKAEIPVMTVQE